MGWKVEEFLSSCGASPASTSIDPAGEFMDNASGMMALIRDLTDCSAFLLAGWDPLSKTHRHQRLVSFGYSEPAIAHINDEYVTDNPAFKLSHSHSALSLRWRDYERDWKLHFQETFTAQTFLIPSGFHEGTTMCLRLPNGQYTGAAHASWSRASAATDDRREIFERFCPMLAAACDLLRAPQLLADTLHPGAFVLIISSSGVARELPGRSAGPHLGDGGALRRLLQENLESWMSPRFLWPDELGHCHKVTLTKCRGDLTLVTEESTSWPFGLSLREIQVLNLITSGASNPEIAQRLFISARTASTHVEHILTKMGCPTRAKLAAVAVAEGLLLPEANKYRNPRKLRLRSSEETHVSSR
jgi:DNA-binding CsgD family transcriptional regulator